MTLYIGQRTHEQWAGEKSLEEAAGIIVERIGPSGRNKDYLYNLAEAMRAIDPGDEYLFRLEDKVSKIDPEKNKIKVDS